MKITFFGAKSYDRESFNRISGQYPQLEMEFREAELSPETAYYIENSEAVCAFVSADLGTKVIHILHERGVKLILMRCAGYNNVDLDTASECGIKVMRVPEYSPEAVAEHAMALALAVSRRLHKAYFKVKENNYSLNGLEGKNFYGKTAGIVGTGKIGAAMARICRGFGMKVIACDTYPRKDLDFIKYVELDELLATSNLVSLHCPLTADTYHMIDIEAIKKMRNNIVLINTSRGGLIKTEDLIAGIREEKFFGVGLDVYEEETCNVFENHEDDIMMHSTTARLLSFPNVIITSHQAFFTEEALSAISETTLNNAMAYLKGENTDTELN